MSVYALDTQTNAIPVNNLDDDHEAWLLSYLSKLERRLELGRYLDSDDHAWLSRIPYADRHAFWLNCVHYADLEGIVAYRELASWQRFETKRKQQYLMESLEARGLIKRLNPQQLQVLQ